MFKSVRVILVNPAHPGNIGSVARAMKTMGFTKLYLVNPEKYPHQEATWLASNAADVLDGAVVVSNLSEAIDGCGFVVGTSARQRRIPWPNLAIRDCANRICSESSQHEVAVVFGPENKGLSNDMLQMCHVHLHIPTSADYTSLNLAATVQIVCYELLMHSLSLQEESQAEPDRLESVWGVEWDEPLATADEVEQLFEHMKKTLTAIEFHNPKAPRQLMTRLRRLYLRARLDKMEMNILRGILTATDKLVK